MYTIMHVQVLLIGNCTFPLYSIIFFYISVAETKLLEEEIFAAVEKVLDTFEG